MVTWPHLVMFKKYIVIYCSKKCKFFEKAPASVDEFIDLLLSFWFEKYRMVRLHDNDKSAVSAHILTIIMIAFTMFIYDAMQKSLYVLVHFKLN